MRFVETGLAGAWLVELEERHDERGFFARAFCREEFARHGIVPDVAQANLSASHRAGTVRGMHFQYPPAAETKFIRCIAGAVHDVIVDLRPDSPTFLRHTAAQLSAADHRALVIPRGFAHGFMTLADDTEVMYLVSEPYTPSEEGGLRFDDPALGIVWPLPATVVSDKDRSWPDLGEQIDDLRRRMPTLA